MTLLAMRLKYGAFAILVAGVAVAAPGHPSATATSPQSKAPSAPANDAASISAGFWGDVKATTSSDEFASLKAAVGCAAKSATAAPEPGAAPRQRVVDLAIANPSRAAQVMTEATAASADPAATRALATVVNMVVPKRTLETAAAMVPSEAQARVTEMRANLSTGIPGLPGIYLGEIEHPKQEAGIQVSGDTMPGAGDGGANDGAGGTSSFGEGRGAVPSGYEPVAGSSMGCPAR